MKKPFCRMLFAFSLILVFGTKSARADDSSQFSAHNFVFGGEDAGAEKNSVEVLKHKALKDKGILNLVREFFAYLEHGPMKITKAGDYKYEGEKVIIKATAKASDDAAYEKSLFVWVCKKSDDCSVAAHYKPVLSADFTYVKAGENEKPSVNKGHVFCDAIFIASKVMGDDDAANDGDRVAGAGAVELLFDLGSSGAQTINVKAVFIPFNASAGTQLAASAKRSLSGEVKTVSSSIVMSEAGGKRRFANSMQRKKGGAVLIGLEIPAASSCSNGVGQLNSSTKVAPTCSKCFVRSMGEGAADPSFAASSSASDCSALSLLDSYDTMTNVLAYTAASVFPVGANGMPAVPSF